MNAGTAALCSLFHRSTSPVLVVVFAGQVSRKSMSKRMRFNVLSRDTRSHC